MNYLLKIVVTFVIVFTLVPDAVHARPANGIISRHKRVSDQRLAELQTILALSKMHGKLVTVPIGFGRVDPERIGRRRRSNLDYDLQKLRRILQDVARDSVPVRDENDQMFFSSWNEDNRDDSAEP